MPPIFVRRYEKPELWLGTANLHGRFCSCPTPTPAGDKPPRYIPLSPPLWIPAKAGITMALRRPHKRMKWWYAGRCNVRERAVRLSWEKASALQSTTCPPLWIPAFAGMTIGGPD